MEQAVLTPLQQKIIDFVAGEPRLAEYYLTGGTALSGYYFQHRYSDDLDFFTFSERDLPALRSVADDIRRLIGADDLRFETRYDRHLYFFKIGEEELKMEFTQYPFRQLDEPIIQNSMRIDSLRDISANKLFTIFDRFDPKDFVDLYFIFHKYDVDSARKDAEKKFEMKVSDIMLGSALAKVHRIEALPRMIKPLTLPELKAYFSDLARSLGNTILEE